jgi:hypothetical protein
VLEKIKAAPTPPKFTQDFLHTKLGITSSSARPIVPFLKKLGFVDESSTPTDRYKRFRNPSSSQQAAAEGLKEAYRVLYDSNEYAHDLSPNDLEGLIVQVTGLDKANQALKAIVGSFNAVKSFSSFDEDANADSEFSDVAQTPNLSGGAPATVHIGASQIGRRINISYTINLNLPETTNIEVFDAIFQSLDRNILKSDE